MSMTGLPGESTEAAAPERPRRHAVMRYLARFDEGELMRWAFRGLLCGAVGVLAFDLRELVETNQGSLWPQAVTETVSAPPAPILPPAVETAGTREQSGDPREFVIADEAALRMPMRFELRAGGLMLAEGSIDQGAAGRFERELEQRGEYVTTVALNSPGGSLEDAMAMARMLRERGIDAEVADGALCASSCPLLLAGGRERRAGEKAAIGVHQFYALGETPMEPAQAMADAQMTTARITRHLGEMGIDPMIWLHALDTPPRSLYYFSAEQLEKYGLVNGAARTASASRRTSGG